VGLVTTSAERLDKGLVDVAVLIKPIATEKYHEIVLPRTEKWGLLVSKASYIAQKDKIAPTDLVGDAVVSVRTS
jgi:hypothetical protein